MGELLSEPSLKHDTQIPEGYNDLPPRKQRARGSVTLGKISVTSRYNYLAGGPLWPYKLPRTLLLIPSQAEVELQEGECYDVTLSVTMA